MIGMLLQVLLFFLQKKNSISVFLAEVTSCGRETSTDCVLMRNLIHGYGYCLGWLTF